MLAQVPLSDEDYEFDTTHRISEEGSDELYQEPDFSAADDLYSSPRAFDPERSPFGGHTDSTHRQPFGRISSSSCSSLGDAGRSPSMGYRRGSDDAPASSTVAAAAEAPAPPSAAAAERLAEGGGVQAAASGSRLWTVLGLGGGASPQKQQRGPVGWGYDGVEDLPPSLRSPAPPTATAATAAAAVAAAAATAAAVVGGDGSAQQGVGPGQEGASSSAAGMSAEDAVIVAEGQAGGEVSWGVEEGEGAKGGGGGSQQDVGSQQEFQDAAGEIEEAGGWYRGASLRPWS